MKKSIDIIKDRKQFYPNQKVKMGEIIESHFIDLRNPPSLAGLKLFEILFKMAGETIAEDKWHQIYLIDLKETAGFKNYDQENLKKLLQELRATTISFQQGNDTFITGLIDTAIIKLDQTDNLIKIKWKFSDPFRNMALRSQYWAVLDHQISLSMNSRYALRLYEILSLRTGLNYKNKDFFSIEELRKRLGVKEGKLQRWNHLYDKAIRPSIEEINNKSNFIIEINKIKKGRLIIGVEFQWKTKEIQLNKNNTHQTSFPIDASIRYNGWGDIAREELPKPLPDLDMVSQQFKNWMRTKNISFNTKNIENIFKNFCRTYVGSNS